MWLAACLWAKKGVEMGRGGGVGFHFQNRGSTMERNGGFPKCLEIPELLVGRGDGSTVGDPRLPARGSGLV